MSQFSDFTIALPVYNGGHLLKECINSILNQSYPHFTLEVFNSFDNTDDSTEYLRSVKDQRLRIIQADRKLTIEENWARFVEYLDTEFGTIIGQDDLLHPDFLSGIRKAIAEFPDASLWHSRYTIIDGNNNITGKSKQLPPTEDASAYLKSILTVSAETVGTGYVFRCADYKRIGGIPAFPDLLFADFALWIKLTSFGSKVNLQHELFSFRIHQSTTSKASPKKYFNGFKRFIDFLIREAEMNERIAGATIENLNAFLVFYSEVISLRIIKSGKSVLPHENIRVDEVLEYCREVSKKAGVKEAPAFTFKTLMAATIDKNYLFNKSYRLFRKIYSKPFLR
jgi:glycosyltransferase involved in cell wall biosynthesis